MQVKVFAASISGRFGGSNENFGDALMEPLLRELFGLEVQFTSLARAELLGVGSILDAYSRRTRYRKVPFHHRRPWRQLHVWGSGFMEGATEAIWPQSLHVHAVRGPFSRNRLLHVHHQPDLPLGDPGLLLPLIWPASGAKNVAVSVIPHFATLQIFRDKYLNILPETWQIIDLLSPPQDVCRKIAASDIVISSSLHGLIVADAYGVPSCWMTPTGRIKGDGTKFQDYFLSVGIIREPISLDLILADPKTLPDLASVAVVKEEMIGSLLSSFPFR